MLFYPLLKLGAYRLFLVRRERATWRGTGCTRRVDRGVEGGEGWERVSPLLVYCLSRIAVARYSSTVGTQRSVEAGKFLLRTRGGGDARDTPDVVPWETRIITTDIVTRSRRDDMFCSERQTCFLPSRARRANNELAYEYEYTSIGIQYGIKDPITYRTTRRTPCERVVNTSFPTNVL